MNAIRKIIVVDDDFLCFEELKEFKNKKVEIIILPVEANEKEIVKSDNKKFLKFAGKLKSGYKDTSLKVDEIIYGKI